MRLGVAASIVRGELLRGDVELDEGRVARVGIGGGGTGLAVPGFVDLQVNGYAGVDLLTEPERWRDVDLMLARIGVTTWQPTLVSAPPDETVRALDAIELGVHLEGPFVALPGAHRRECLRPPDLGRLGTLLDRGRVTTMTIAPELSGALDLVGELRARGVVVSLGHSAADAATAHSAFDAGASTVTHLFNAMRLFAHRDPGLAGAALAREDVLVQLICDGLHLADETVLLAWRAARGRFAVVSDATAAAGQGDGRFQLGGTEIEVKDGVARTADGALAGSTCTLPEVVRRLVSLRVPLAEAVDAATRVPARILGRTDIGVLEPGARGDVVVLDDDLCVTRIFRGGQEVLA
jgi:N-acetylglucosamine-6-phosphate deacetylase